VFIIVRDHDYLCVHCWCLEKLVMTTLVISVTVVSCVSLFPHAETMDPTTSCCRQGACRIIKTTDWCWSNSECSWGG